MTTTTAAAATLAVEATCVAGAPKVRVVVLTSFVTTVRVGSDGHDGGSPDVSRVCAEAAPVVPVSGISPQVGVQLSVFPVYIKFFFEFLLALQCSRITCYS